ncbi:MAG: hypothetical protein ACOYL5_12845 [Phototrophicaceae bacterium]
MTPPTPQEPSPPPENRVLIDFTMELIRLVTRFLFDLTRLSAKGAWIAFRAISGNPATQQAIADRARNLLKRPASNTTVTPVLQSANPKQPKEADNDPEAADLLAEFLASNQSTQALDESGFVSNTASTTPELIQQAKVFDSLEARQARLLRQVPPTIEEATQTEAPLVSLSPAERAAVADEKLAKQAQVRQAVEADRARIAAERQAREDAFKQAEEERKRRQVEQASQRLSDRPGSESPPSSLDDDAQRRAKGK